MTALGPVSEGEGFEMPASACPSCGHKLDHAQNTWGQPCRPIPGDITMCIECTDVLVFTDGLAVRWPTPNEWRAFPPETQAWIRVVQQAILATKLPS